MARRSAPTVRWPHPVLLRAARRRLLASVLVLATVLTVHQSLTGAERVRAGWGSTTEVVVVTRPVPAGDQVAAAAVAVERRPERHRAGRCAPQVGTTGPGHGRPGARRGAHTGPVGPRGAWPGAGGPSPGDRRRHRPARRSRAPGGGRRPGGRGRDGPGGERPGPGRPGLRRRGTRTEGGRWRGGAPARGGLRPPGRAHGPRRTPRRPPPSPGRWPWSSWADGWACLPPPPKPSDPAPPRIRRHLPGGCHRNVTHVLGGGDRSHAPKGDGVGGGVRPPAGWAAARGTAPVAVRPPGRRPGAWTPAGPPS